MKQTLLRVFLVLVAVPLWMPGPAGAQDNALTVDRIFSSGEFAARGYSVEWMPEGGEYFVLEPADEGPGNDIVLVDPVVESRRVLVTAANLTPDGADTPIDVESFQVSPDGNRILVFNNSRRVWRYNTRGDYWVVDLVSGAVTQLGGPDAEPSTLMFAKFSPDSRYVAYVRDRNIYVEDLQRGTRSQITSTETPDIINGTSDWVYEEELDVRDGFRWSADGNVIAYWRFDTSEVGVFTMLNNTDALYPRLIEFQYPKVGTTNSAVTIGLYNMVDGETHFTECRSTQGDDGGPRENYIARLDPIPGTDDFLVQRLNRLQNRNEVIELNGITAEHRLVMEDTNEAWVDACDDVQWLEGGRRFTFVSERDGWRHVYAVERESGQATLLTPGEFDVEVLYHIDADDRSCLYLASPDDPRSRYLYRQSFEELDSTRLTPAEFDGWNEYSLSADGSSAVHQWSAMGKPPRVASVSLPGHDVIERHRDNANVREAISDLAPCEHEFFRVAIDTQDATTPDQSESLMIDGWAMKPPGFEPDKVYPVIVYVYGEPWGTTVTDQWGGSTYLWHRLLCEQGYVVVSFDNRGAKVPRGAAWRKAIYRQIGIVNASDQAKALQAALEQFSWMDRRRVGIWGWSGGGSSTLQAMFKYPELYHVGISVAPVPDQRYYDTIYQERYMATPELNPEGFEQGSAVNFAGALEGQLLLIHGTGDDNCHYQTMELLINELIAENKPFEMMAYPNRSHGIYEYRNTSRHLRNLMLEFWLRNLVAGPQDR